MGKERKFFIFLQMKENEVLNYGPKIYRQKTQKLFAKLTFLAAPRAVIPANSLTLKDSYSSLQTMVAQAENSGPLAQRLRGQMVDWELVHHASE